MNKIHTREPDLGIRRRRGHLPLLVVTVLASGIDLTAFYLLDQPGLSQSTRLAIALMPLPGNMTLLLMVLGILRTLDEFQKRVQFEAVAAGFLATGVAVFIYGYLQKAQAVGPLNMGLVWIFMLVFYGIGYFVAVSHYK